ncbi:MAG TPA: ribosomal protein S18-alanine N-acetyltransferase [Abditibacteriaceae bacterium]|jgi:ribosomal-protein-alanine acetyltransferase
MTIVLRRAVQNDLPVILEIDGAAFSQPWSPASFEQCFADDKTYVVVAENNERVLAFGVAYTVGDEGEIATLAVDAAARGQGLGEKILQSLLNFCRERGAHKVFLEVRASNATAQRLYKRCGFTEVGLRRHYYADAEDAVIMRHDTSVAEDAPPATDD